MDQDNKSTRSIFRLIPVCVLSAASAVMMYLMRNSVTGAVRDLIITAVIVYIITYIMGSHVDLRLSLILTLLGLGALMQAVVPEFMIAAASFSVVVMFLSTPFAGALSALLFSFLPFMVTESSFEYFLFMTVTGLLAVSLMYAGSRTGKYVSYLVIFSLVYIILYTGLIVLKRDSVTPELIINPCVGLILDIIIMEIAGYNFYSNVVKKQDDLYAKVVDPEYPLLIKLKSTNKQEYKRAIHTAHFTELFAEKFGYDRAIMKGLGFYHRIGVLDKGEGSLELRTMKIAEEEEFPQGLLEMLQQYGEVKAGERISAEVSITVIIDTVITDLMKEFEKGGEGPDLGKFIDRSILKLFSGKDSLLKRSAIPYGELEDIRKHLKGERIYYDFLR